MQRDCTSCAACEGSVRVGFGVSLPEIRRALEDSGAAIGRGLPASARPGPEPESASYAGPMSAPAPATPTEETAG